MDDTNDTALNRGCLAAALAYWDAGWSVVPVRPREKRPMIAWQKFQQQPPGRDEVAAWYERWPDANVAVVTGAVSNLIVVDVDPGHGGAASLAALESEHGPLPLTTEARSGGGGRHLYFRHPGGRLNNRVALRPGVDIRGDGGVIVAPPSVHPNGQRYAWRSGRAPEQLAPGPLPDWLLRLILGEAGAGPARAGHPVSYWRELLAQGIAEGGRNSTLASICGHLLWRQVDLQVITELLLCWNRERCRPPLPDAEVVAVIRSVAQSQARARGENG